VLAEPNRTPYDLNFRVLGFPVRVHPLFWLGAAVLGSNFFDRGGLLLYGLIWIAVVFVSILVHELGHALAFRRYGAGAHIVLYIIGGLAVPWSSVAGWKRRVIVSLAGPFAGFALYGLLYGSNKLNPWITPDTPMPVVMLFIWLLNVNLWWGVFNLLPVWPLDGGQVSDEVCRRYWPRNGQRISLMISVGVGSLVCLYSLACVINDRQAAEWLSFLPWWFPHGGWWTAILFGLLAIQSYLFLQQLQRTDRYWHDSDRVPWER
jgi:stage IV sporulation protein FB